MCSTGYSVIFCPEQFDVFYLSQKKEFVTTLCFSVSISCVCWTSTSRQAETSCSACSATWCPLLSPQLPSCSSFNTDFIAHLSRYLSTNLKKENLKRTEEAETNDEKRFESREVQFHVDSTEVDSAR